MGRMIATVLAFAAATSSFAGLGDLLPAPKSVERTEGELRVRDVESAVKDETDPSVPKEGYRMEISMNGITVAASDEAGRFYARQTLAQLGDTSGGETVFPCVRISDAPEFPWRGWHLDVSRHFFGKDAILGILDLLAQFKYNVFHWHLTDTQGWRFPVPGHPELTAAGAARPMPDYNKDVVDDRLGWTGSEYYTEEDIREVVAYAAARHITVVPGIEFPGHSRAVIFAYPELTCLDPAGFCAAVHKDNGDMGCSVLCLANPKTFEIYDAAIDQVCRLFPSDVVHIGGEEVAWQNWMACPKCKAKMKELGLEGHEAYQRWATLRLVDRLRKNGRRAAGWVEFLYGGPIPGAVAMCWTRRAMMADKAIARGADVIAMYSSHCYFNNPQGLKDDPYPHHGGGLVPLDKIYGFDPREGVPAGSAGRVLGSEACNWGEATYSVEMLQWKAWPRSCAMAEILWTGPGARSYDDFRRRAKAAVVRLRAAGVHSAPVPEGVAEK